MPKPFDATLKHLIQHYPADWLRVLGLPAGPVELLDAYLATITTEADRVLRIRHRPPWLLHIELQSGQDADIGQRLLRYNVLLTARHDLPVHSALMLLRPAADGPRVTGLVERGLPAQASYLTFRYQVVRLWEMPVESLLTAGAGTLPLAPLADVKQAELPGLIRQMESRLKSLKTADAALLWSASYILAGLRYSREFVQSLYRGVRAMKESSTYQAILEEGRSAGLTQGRVEEARDMLLRIGRKHLGEPDAGTMKSLEAIQDLQRLEKLAERLLEATSWPELFASRPRRNGKRQAR
jgi:predicted transposase YdaD